MMRMSVRVWAALKWYSFLAKWYSPRNYFRKFLNGICDAVGSFFLFIWLCLRVVGGVLSGIARGYSPKEALALVFESFRHEAREQELEHAKRMRRLSEDLVRLKEENKKLFEMIDRNRAILEKGEKVGADLYIESLYKERQKAYSQELDSIKAEESNGDVSEDRRKELSKKWLEIKDAIAEGCYFRDSYNVTSVLWQIGLSWWKDVIPMLDEGNYLPLARTDKLISLIEDRPVPPSDKINLEGATVDDKENSREVWHKFFIEKREKLLEFLKKSRRLEEPIRCSL